MPRQPLFRDEENAISPGEGAIQPAAKNAELRPKASLDNALWNRMNLAMRLSCQRSKPLLKR